MTGHDRIASPRLRAAANTCVSSVTVPTKAWPCRRRSIACQIAIPAVSGLKPQITAPPSSDTPACPTKSRQGNRWASDLQSCRWVKGRTFARHSQAGPTERRIRVHNLDVGRQAAQATSSARCPMKTQARGARCCAAGTRIEPRLSADTVHCFGRRFYHAAGRLSSNGWVTPCTASLMCPASARLAKALPPPGGLLNYGCLFATLWQWR